MNPRGYTWQKYLQTVWWRMALGVGFVLVEWRGTTRELDWYLPTMLAFGAYVVAAVYVDWSLLPMNHE